MAKRMQPESVLRRLAKEARQRVYHRDLGACVVCGSREKLEAAHIVPTPTNYFLSHPYESDEQLEKDAAPFYHSLNMVLLCQKCHWILSWRSHYEEFAASVGPKKAMEMTAKALILFGVSLEDLKKGEDRQLMEHVSGRMFSIYGPDWLKHLEELERARQRRRLKHPCDDVAET